jgi:transcriptional regulator with GAF, ATPase, and Fis domain
LNLSAQGKLLRVLQEREVERVGGTETRRVDVRVIAATNVDLRAESRSGAFREDLYFRLNVFPIRIPPLRERREDIPLLARHFLRKYAERHGRAGQGITERAMDRLVDYRFPGNVRELENLIERAVILAPEDGGPIDVGQLFGHGEEGHTLSYGLGVDGSLVDGRDTGAPPTTDMVSDILAREVPLEQLESMLIDAAVTRADGNLSEAARMLGLTRAQLAYRFKKAKE